MNLLFLSSISLLCVLFIYLGFTYLPGERWQMLAIIPYRKLEGASWQGINFTYYGFLVATASILALLLSLILLRAAGAPLAGVLAVVGLLFALCIPAARFMARIVEKKQYTFTIGGAFFCGLLATPVIIILVNQVMTRMQQPTLNMSVLLAAVSIGYILGEGLGRLGCVSFGCCYGKPLKACTPLTQTVYAHLFFIFTGTTKKAVYEGGLEGEKLVPVQGITCILYTCAALISTWCFLHEQYTTAFLLSLSVSQIWRIYSETLRADFRGFGKISAYQKMSLASLPIGICLTLIPKIHAAPVPDIKQGLTLLADPIPMIALQVLWAVLFFRFGKSMVTTSTLNFDIVQKHI